MPRGDVLQRREAVEVVERHRLAEGEAGPLDKAAVGMGGDAAAAANGIRDKADVHIGTHRAVGRLVAGVEGDVTARAPGRVVGRAVVDVGVGERTGRGAAVVVVIVLLTHPAADFQAHIGARDVVEPHTVQAANLHVLDRFGRARGEKPNNDGCFRHCGCSRSANGPPRLPGMS